MKESEIRTDESLLELERRLKNDVRSFVKKYTDLKNVPCPACGNEGNELAFRKDSFTFERCIACETLFVNPRPTPEMLRDYYENATSMDLYVKKIYPESEGARLKNIVFNRVDSIVAVCEKELIKKGTHLDIGAGFGTLCGELKRRGYFEQSIAVESSKAMAGVCRSRGVSVIERMIEDVEIQDIDVVTAFELIEHLFNPRDFLVRCHELLNEGGLLIMTMPNVHGFDIMTLAEESNYVCAPAHLNYFNPESIEGMITKNGFEVLEITTPGKLDAELVRKKALEKRISLEEQPFLKKVLITDWENVGAPFQEFLATNRLSGHMWVAAKKV